jgi:hypothetical protein
VDRRREGEIGERGKERDRKESERERKGEGLVVMKSGCRSYKKKTNFRYIRNLVKL